MKTFYLMLITALALAQLPKPGGGGGGGAGDGQGYATIENEGTPLTQRGTVNMVGAGADCVDSGGKTVCTITSGGSPSYPESTEAGASYSLDSDDCFAFKKFSHATPTVTLPTPLSGATNGCNLFVQPTAGNAALANGLSDTIYRNQVAWIHYNGTSWNIKYLKVTDAPSGAITWTRGTDGTLIPEFQPGISLDLNGTLNNGTAGNLRLTALNNGTGTVLNYLAKIGAANTVQVMTASDTAQPLGIVIAGAGTSGTATIVYRGNVPAVADNTIAEGDYLILGTGTGGRVRSNGATKPTSGYSLGRARTAATVGNTFTMWFEPEDMSGSGTSTTEGTYSALPAAGTAGRLYYATDGHCDVYRDTGSAWTCMKYGIKVTVPPTTGWTQVSSPTWSTSGSGYWFEIAGDADTYDFRSSLRAVPAAPYTVIFGINHGMRHGGASGSNQTICGMALSDGTTTADRLMVFGPLGGANSYVGLRRMTNYTTFSGDSLPTAYNWATTSLPFWKIEDNNTNLLFSVSPDGRNWTQIVSYGRTAFLTATQIGVACNAAGQTLTPLGLTLFSYGVGAP